MSTRVHEYLQFYSSTSTSIPFHQHRYSSYSRNFHTPAQQFGELPCHHLCLFSNPCSHPPMASSKASSVAAPFTPRRVASLLAAEERDLPISVSSTPQSSIAPSDSASQASRQWSHKIRIYDNNDLTDHLLPTSNDENLLCECFFLMSYCTNIHLFTL
jgi:hypothetical protein